MTGEEQDRRVLLFWHALWEAREEFVDRAERGPSAALDPNLHARDLP